MVILSLRVCKQFNVGLREIMQSTVSIVKGRPGGGGTTTKVEPKQCPGSGNKLHRHGGGFSAGGPKRIHPQRAAALTLRGAAVPNQSSENTPLVRKSVQSYMLPSIVKSQ